MSAARIESLQRLLFVVIASCCNAGGEYWASRKHRGISPAGSERNPQLNCRHLESFRKDWHPVELERTSSGWKARDPHHIRPHAQTRDEVVCDGRE